MTERKKDKGNGRSEVKTFTVKSGLGELKKNSSFATNTSKKPSKEQIINQIIKASSEGNIIKAAKYSQTRFEAGFLIQ